MLLEKPEGVTVDEASTAIVSAASQLGKSLRRFERSLELHRDNALSTAFPSAGKKAEKSRLRFGNQFIAGTTKENNLTGFLADLSLLNYTSSARDRVALTDPGWWFAMAGNPVLDGTQEGPTQKFTDEERHILLSHIQDSVPREDSAFRSVLTAGSRTLELYPYPGPRTRTRIHHGVPPRREDLGLRRLLQSARGS